MKAEDCVLDEDWMQLLTEEFMNEWDNWGESGRKPFLAIINKFKMDKGALPLPQSFTPTPGCSQDPLAEYASKLHNAKFEQIEHYVEQNVPKLTKEQCIELIRDDWFETKASQYWRFFMDLRKDGPLTFTELVQRYYHMMLFHVLSNIYLQ